MESGASKTGQYNGATYVNTKGLKKQAAVEGSQAALKNTTSEVINETSNNAAQEAGKVIISEDKKPETKSVVQVQVKSTLVRSYDYKVVENIFGHTPEYKKYFEPSTSIPPWGEFVDNLYKKYGNQKKKK